MAGKFVNTQSLKTTMNSNIESSVLKILNNPYYYFSDKKSSSCTYYNLNTTMTTLDEATRSNYAEIGFNSPLRFNKVTGFLLFGVTKMEPNLDINEFGLESSDILGEALVLPYTIIPYPGDYFVLDQIKSKKQYFFRVTQVNPNTLETGATMYKINYTLKSSDGLRDIEPQVVKRYKFVPSNMGTNFASLMEEETYNTALDMQDLTTKMKDNYVSLFYDPRIQSFSFIKRKTGYDDPNFFEGGCDCYYGEAGFHVYDPYLIAFLQRNKIIDGASEYLYVQQAMYLPSTFDVEYDRTIFHSIETQDITSHIGKFAGNLILCRQTLSLMYAYPDDYYYMDYTKLRHKLHVIDIFGDPSFGDRLKNNNKTGTDVLKDIIIGFMNGEGVTEQNLVDLKHLDYVKSMEMYYLLPFVIFILEQGIQSSLSGDGEAVSADGNALLPQGVINPRTESST